MLGFFFLVFNTRPLLGGLFFLLVARSSLDLVLESGVTGCGNARAEGIQYSVSRSDVPFFDEEVAVACFLASAAALSFLRFGVRLLVPSFDFWMARGAPFVAGDCQ